MDWQWGPITATDTVANIQTTLVAAWQLFQTQHIDGVPSQGALDQVNSALNAAGGVAAQGVCGARPRVTLTGHANPSHTPTPGLPNDYINILIEDSTQSP